MACSLVQMMKKHLFRLSILVGIAVLSIALFKKMNLSNSGVSYASDPIKNNSNRNWANSSILKLKTLNQHIIDSVYNPIVIKDYNNILYIADYGDMEIKAFDKNGGFIRRYGNGIGRGPGEFTQILDFTVSGNELYAIDLHTMMINIFNIQTGEYKRSISLTKRAMRIENLGNVNAVLNLSDFELIDLYNGNDSLINSFGDNIENEIDNPLSLTGTISKTTDNKLLIFAPYYASFLFYFDLSGELQKSIQTLDQLDFRESKSSINKTNDLVFHAPKAVIEVEDVESHNNTLHILYSTTEDKQITSFIDIYDIHSVAYQQSIQLPYMARGISIINNTLYTISYDDDLIRAYTFK